MDTIVFAFAMLLFFSMMVIGVLLFFAFWYIVVPLLLLYLFVKNYGRINGFFISANRSKAEKIDIQRINYSNIEL